MMLTLSILNDPLAVCRLPSQADVPAWVWQLPFFCATRTSDELSFVLPEASLSSHTLPSGWKTEAGWRAFKVLGPLDFSLTGILASLASPLAQIQVSIFALSTYDTDYLLVRSVDLEAACATLSAQGFIIHPN